MVTSDLTALVLLFFVCSVGGQIIYRGKCGTAPIQENFNATRFSGKWHEVSRSFMLFELLLRCVETEYSVRGPHKMDITIRGIDTIGIKRSYEGKTQVKDFKEPAKLKAKFRIMPTSVNYYILKTDYDSYAVMWSCNNLMGGSLGHTETLWLLSRTPVMREETKHKIYGFLDEHKIRRHYLETNTRQRKCLSSIAYIKSTTTPEPFVTELLNSTLLEEPVTELVNVTDTTALQTNSSSKDIL